MNCPQVEEQLPRYIDGEHVDKATAIAAHIETCEVCSASAHAQRVARSVLRARATHLTTVAPPGLRTRLIANFPGDLKASGPQDLSWTGRLTAFATAAVVVLTLGAVLLPIATVRSTAVLAAQLALDHLKCFTIDGDADGQPISNVDAQATLLREFDLSVIVPASLPSEQLDLLAVRRCLYGDGRAAHLLYRVKGEPVSLFVLQGLTRPAAELSLFGHDEVVWTQGDRTYMLVARAGMAGDMGRVASYLRNEAK